MNLKPYPEYKESGNGWLGKTPQYWDVLPNRAIFAEVKDRNHSNEEMLSVTITRGVIKQQELLSDSSKKDSSKLDRSAYKLVQPRDIAYNKMRAWQGAIGVSDVRGIVSPAYIVIRLREDQNARYFHYLYRTPQFAKEAERWSYGITSDMWSLRPEHFKMIYSPIPRREEQDAIVRFIDYANGRIERAIRAKRKLIALLNEQKQTIIHRAVTRGLDPNVPLKPSGIPWLGDIPKHWKVAPLGRLCVSRCDGPFGSGLKSSHYVESGVRVIRLQNLGSCEFRNRAAAYIAPSHYATLGDHSVIAGDLLIAGLGDEKIPAGRACVAPIGIEPAMVKADCFRFRLREGVSVVQFLALHLSATAAVATSCLSTGATRQRINLSATSARAIALPPIFEQREIILHVETVTAPLNTAIARTEREIALMGEYRTRLAADIVIGKLDVREAAAKLPDTPGDFIGEGAETENVAEEDLELEVEESSP